jgi:hypothetical protein
MVPPPPCEYDGVGRLTSRNVVSTVAPSASTNQFDYDRVDAAQPTITS